LTDKYIIGFDGVQVYALSIGGRWRKIGGSFDTRRLYMEEKWWRGV